VLDTIETRKDDGMAEQPVRVLCVVDYYLPGFKGGGPIRTIANMCKVLGEQVEMSIFTRDHDLGSEETYPNIEVDSWNEVSDANVFYASRESFGHRGLGRAQSSLNYDLLYLNSFFSARASIQVLLWARVFNPKMPILLAPRGEFSEGALSLNSTKKRLYIEISKLLGLYSKVNWHASTQSERSDIMRQFPNVENRIFLAEDPVDIGEPVLPLDPALSAENDNLRLAFISRISPMKNLDALLRILGNADFDVLLDIYGPIEDDAYWNLCKSQIATLPDSVVVNYAGSVNPDEVSRTFSRYDAFAFPTRGENFGHVIFEALRSGTPVILSENTPWVSDERGAVSVIPLDAQLEWLAQLRKIANGGDEQKQELGRAARSYAERFVHDSQIREKNLMMFNAVSQGLSADGVSQGLENYQLDDDQ